MVLTLVLICGPGLGEPLTSLHTTRDGARTRLAERAEALLVDRLGYVPTQLQAEPSVTQLVDALAGIGLTASVEELPVAA